MTDTIFGLPAGPVIQGFSNVISAFVAIAVAVLGYLFNAHLNRVQRRRRSINVAAALAGEIDAVLQLIELRKYEEFFQGVLELLRTTNEAVKVLEERYSKNEFFAVYRGNIEELGGFSHEIVGEVVKLYTVFFALQEDFRTTIQPSWRTTGITSQQYTLGHIMASIDYIKREGPKVINALRDGERIVRD
jgi:hypothetical protein